MTEVVVIELQDAYTTPEHGRLAVEQALQKTGFLKVELGEDDVVVATIPDSRDTEEEVTNALAEAGVRAYVHLDTEGKYGGRPEKMGECILPIKVVSPAGVKVEDVAELINKLIAVGQADASESDDDEDIDNPEAGLAASLGLEVKPQVYLVIGTLNGKSGPAVSQIEQFLDKNEALTLAVRLAREQDAPENDDEVRKELDENGTYYPAKYAEWAVTLIHL